MFKKSLLVLTISASTILFATEPFAEQTTKVTVTADNYPTLETNRQMVNKTIEAGGMNKFAHRRQLTQLDEQKVVRLNRDTYYSWGIVDISKGATYTLPDVGDKYISAQVITEDHRIQAMKYGAGTYEISTHDDSQTHAIVFVRLDSRFTEAEAKEIQDKMRIDANSAELVTPINFDMEKFIEVENKLKAQMGVISNRDGAEAITGMFTDPLDASAKDYTLEKYTVGAAIGWAGAQKIDNVYEVSDNYPSSTCYQATFKNPENKAFWSVTVYNGKGFMFNEKANINSYSADMNNDGTFTVSFGCGDGAINNLVTANETAEFNIGVRHYQASDKVRSGEIRILPTVKAVK